MTGSLDVSTRDPGAFSIFTGDRGDEHQLEDGERISVSIFADRPPVVGTVHFYPSGWDFISDNPDDPSLTLSQIVAEELDVEAVTREGIATAVGGLPPTTPAAELQRLVVQDCKTCVFLQLLPSKVVEGAQESRCAVDADRRRPPANWIPPEWCPLRQARGALLVVLSPKVGRPS